MCEKEAEEAAEAEKAEKVEAEDKNKDRDKAKIFGKFKDLKGEMKQPVSCWLSGRAYLKD